MHKAYGRGYEMAIKETLAWLETHYLEYPNEDKADMQRFIKDFKEALKYES